MKRPRMAFLLWRKRYFRPFGAPKRGENIASERGVQRRRKGGRLIRGGEGAFRGRRGGGFAKCGEFPLRNGGRFFTGCGLHSGGSLRPTQFCELQILYMLFPPFVTQKVEPKCAAVKRFRGRSCDFAESDAYGTFEAIKRSPILYAPSLRPPSVRNRFCRGLG